MKKELKKRGNIKMRKENKIIYTLKYIWFIIKLIFYVVIVILSFGFAFIIFAGSNLEEEIFYEDEYDLARRRVQKEE